ncbi:restriction endonuclease subunit S [Prevotella sp. LMAG:51]|mgnify:CR=1 FL=1|uniref:restriction endonuclease subunit S n=1 Tax=Prevotella sp. LMAG:51 TaxID=1969564 RepID=UPI00257C9F73|nr:restriction endonuclease subunit S [Prevotella sp. LMAG:51]
MEFKKYKLGDCFRMAENGLVIKQTKAAKGMPITRIETLSNDCFNRDRLGYGDIFDEEKYSHYILDDKDLLMSHINSRTFLGRTVLYRKRNGEKIIHGMNVLRIKTNQDILDPIFASYLFRTSLFKRHIDNIRKDAINQSSFALSDLKNIELYIPTVKEQNKIAYTLQLLDSKIALNRQINDNLEAMAKQLYDYWFVQFDFPNEEGKPYKSSGGAMVWNEKLKREIPQGWSNGVLSDVANITMGQSPDGSSYNEDGEGIIFYQGSTDFGLRFPDIRQYTTSPSRYANKGSILMSVRAPVGALNIANNDCCIGRGLSALSSKIGSMTHLYYLMNDFRLKFEGMNSAGTTFGSITKDELFSLPVIIPTKSVISEFEQVCEPIFDKQMIIGEEINALTKQRDELLPLLMNGQATVNYHLSDD